MKIVAPHIPGILKLHLSITTTTEKIFRGVKWIKTLLKLYGVSNYRFLTCIFLKV